MTNFDFLKILEILILFFSALIVPFCSFYLQIYFLKRARQKIVKALFLCEKFLNF